MRRTRTLWRGIIMGSFLLTGRSQAAFINVPNDFASIQAALDAAGPGDTVEVCTQAQPYFEKLVFTNGGSAVGGYLTLRACAGQTPILDGTGVAGDNMILIENRSYVKVIGFEIRNDLGVNDGSGVRNLGAGSHLEVRDNDIHDIRGQDAMGITVYGTEPTAISDLVIDGNALHDCQPYRSEALTLNGNVTDFATNNTVRDVNNIGIDFIRRRDGHTARFERNCGREQRGWWGRQHGGTAWFTPCCTIRRC